MFTPHQVSCVTCHLSCVNCHMSPVTCHLSHVNCHMSSVTCHLTPFTCPLFSSSANIIKNNNNKKKWCSQSVINQANPVQFNAFVMYFIMVGDFLSYSSGSLKYRYIVGGIILYYDFDFVKNCILECGILSYLMFP